MKYQFQKALYSRTALLKAAYHFTDDYYVHLAADHEVYTVTLRPKHDRIPSLPQEHFQNEILTQTVKETVAAETKNLRTLLVARALSSSMIVEEFPENDVCEPDENAEQIMKDWFAKNE